MKLLINISRVQGVYYLLTGIWPLLDIHSFMDVTGPKTDVWLVRTVGILTADIGIVLLLAQHQRKLEIQLAVLAILAAVGLGLVDIVNSLTGRIPVIYLFDAFLQAIFATAWAIASIKTHKTRRHHKS